MVKKICLYVRNQSGYLLLLFLLLVIPLALFFQFSAYPLPKIQYVVLGFLFVNQYFFFNEKKFRRSSEAKVSRLLQKELGRTPSKIEIHKRVNFYVTCRLVTVLISAVAVVAIMIYFKEF